MTDGRNFPMVVVFGANPHRRDEIVQLLSQIQGITVYGASEEIDGFKEIIKMRSKVKLVLIGPRCSAVQRMRLVSWLSKNLPGVPISQPGFDYGYTNSAVLKDVKNKLRL